MSQNPVPGNYIKHLQIILSIYNISNSSLLLKCRPQPPPNGTKASSLSPPHKNCSNMKSSTMSSTRIICIGPNVFQTRRSSKYSPTHYASASIPFLNRHLKSPVSFPLPHLTFITYQPRSCLTNSDWPCSTNY